jgi:membrane associated rhomboid family serine protease
MFIPLHDDTPLKVIRFQWMTGALILLNTLLFLFTHFAGGGAAEQATLYFYGVVPVELVSNLPTAIDPLPEPLTLITYQFLHAGWLHLIANMLFLWVFADNIEDAFGRISFLLFYVTCGIGAALFYAFLTPASDSPLIGASGAVGGILAAYMLLYPRARIWILLFMRLPVRIPAVYVLASWFALQIIMLLLATEDAAMVAWSAHVGGFATGFVLTIVLRSRLVVQTAP